MEDEIPHQWTIDRPLTDVKEREILFLLLEAAGYEIFDDTRINRHIKEFPYIGTSDVSRDDLITGKRFVPEKREFIIISYEEIIELLKKEIMENFDPTQCSTAPVINGKPKT